MVRRSHRAGSWSPPLVAAMARRLAREGRREAGRLAALADRARRINEDGYAADLDQAAAETLETAHCAEAATLFWVAAPMALLAMDASQDIPAINGADAPATTGLMVMAEPLPAWDTSAIGGLALRDGARTDIPHTKPVEVDALTWHLDPHPSGVKALTIELMCRPGRLPFPIMGHQSTTFLVPFTRIRTLIPVSLDAARAVGPDGAPVDPADIGILAWLQAAWTLMATPSLTESTVVAGTGKPRTTRTNAAAGRGHGADDDGVTVIDLHPQRRRLITDEADGAGDSPRRRLTTRHVVRGHWTHQPHGPKQSLRRLQWIDDYIRGPQDAPLTTRAHVWAWRRQ